jgi:hypothetical protein
MCHSQQYQWLSYRLKLIVRNQLLAPSIRSATPLIAETSPSIARSISARGNPPMMEGTVR